MAEQIGLALTGTVEGAAWVHSTGGTPSCRGGAWSAVVERGAARVRVVRAAVAEKNPALLFARWVGEGRRSTGPFSN